MSDSATYLDGYPFKGEVLGLVNLEPCTNFTEMFQNFNYTDPENPSSGGATVELTNALNYTQLGAFPTPGYSIDDLPSNDMDLFPWTVQDGTVFGAEAYDTKCWNRSLTVPITCTENCLEYFDMFGATWFNFGDLYCKQSYPVESSGEVETIPTPGNITMILTNQCSQYTYGPPGGEGNVTMYTLTDTFGNVYALQSATRNATSAEEWQELVETTEYPSGWTLGSEVLTKSQTHYAYIIGDDCWLMILKDANGNAWQQYKYGQPLESSDLLASISCPPLAKSVPAMPPGMSPEAPPSMVLGSSPSILLHVIALLVVLLLAWRA
ncbi:hypothetical protein M9435_001902 [Picochlorum sp. BPE23]|nr:hypothetical protein M9435_001902 [Picochlorum sp. BPE23]